MFTVKFDSANVRSLITFDEADALKKSIMAATRGVGSSIYQEDEEIWGVEVDTKLEDTDPTFPVIVHARRGM